MREHGGGFVHFIDKRAKLVVEFHPSLKGSGLRIFEEAENVE